MNVGNRRIQIKSKLVRRESKFRFGNIDGYRTYFTAHCVVSRISRRLLSQLSMNTMDAMTSDRNVRRPRIRTESERNRRRQNDWANYAPFPPIRAPA